MSRQLGHELMPHQRLIADVGLEVDPSTGLLAYDEVIVTIMRQQGKTLLVLVYEVERCVSWDTPQRVAYTAQTGWAASKKLMKDHVPILERSRLRKLIQPPHGKVRRAADNWGVDFPGGSIDVLASTETAGHGLTLDVGVIDEAWADTDTDREQSMRPAMLTRPNSQLLIASVAGTAKSSYLRSKVDAGRAAAAEDRGSGIAYFEWSIPDDADIDDPEVWWEFMPALGWTVTEAKIASARQGMTEDDFRRHYGNQWVQDPASDRLLPAAVWDRVQSPHAAPDPVRFGVDVNHDRSSASIVASDGVSVELVAHAAGVGWVRGKATELQSRHGGLVVVDGGGPAAPVADDLEADEVRVHRMKGPDMVSACGRMYDAIADGRVLVRPHAKFDAAAAGVVKRPVGDRFVWSRQSSSEDITPLVAATLAYAPATEDDPMTPMVACR